MEWDHTAVTAAGIDRLSCIVMNLASKSKARPRSAMHFHPYRKKPNRGLKITTGNFSDLKMIGKAIAS